MRRVKDKNNQSESEVINNKNIYAFNISLIYSMEEDINFFQKQLKMKFDSLNEG